MRSLTGKSETSTPRHRQAMDHMIAPLTASVTIWATSPQAQHQQQDVIDRILAA